jgi:Ser/Thr protein kinase RdoA (MazF antagonist)
MDVAVCATYFFDAGRPSKALETLASVVGGYLSVRGLTEAEIRLVPDLIRARCALALAVTRSRVAAEDLPQEQALYVLRNEATSQARLDFLENYGTKRVGDQLARCLTANDRPPIDTREGAR